jgi:hypothetical protein
MQLPIRNVVFEVFRFLWDNRIDLLHMMAAPVLALSIFGIGISAMITQNAPHPDGTTISGMQVAGLFLAVALPTLFYVMFAVAWHRRCLKSEEQTTILTALRWDRRKTIFLGRVLVITLIAIAISLPPTSIGMIIGGGAAVGLAAGGVGGPSTGMIVLQLAKAAVAVIILLVQARLALWLPAAAVDQKMTIMEAWAIGRRNSWRLVAIFLLSIAPAMVVAVLVSSAFSAIAHATGLAGSLTFRFIAGLALNFVYYIVIAASVSALSISYRELRQPPNRGMPFYV